MFLRRRRVIETFFEFCPGYSVYAAPLAGHTVWLAFAWQAVSSDSYALQYTMIWMIWCKSHVFEGVVDVVYGVVVGGPSFESF